MPWGAALAILVEQAPLSYPEQCARVASSKNLAILSWKAQNHEISIKNCNFLLFAFWLIFLFRLQGSVNTYLQVSSQTQELNRSWNSHTNCQELETDTLSRTANTVTKAEVVKSEKFIFPKQAYDKTCGSSYLFKFTINTGDSKLLPGLSDLLQVLRSSLNIIGSSYDDFGGAVLVDTRKWSQTLPKRGCVL